MTRRNYAKNFNRKCFLPDGILVSTARGAVSLNPLVYTRQSGLPADIVRYRNSFSGSLSALSFICVYTRQSGFPADILSY